MQPLWASEPPVTVERYHQMIRDGVLASGDPFELLEGVIVSKMSKNPPHSAATIALTELLAQLCAGWHCRSQEPITLTDSEPEPDLVVVRGVWRDYLHRHPCVGDIGLLVEVCASSHHRDRGQKKRLYARAGIEPYWIVDVDNRRIEVYTRPDGLGDYAAVEVVEPGGWVDVVVGGHLAGRLAVNDILPTAAVPQ